MPRLDNSDEEVQEAYSYVFNERDPGETPPVDLCYDCGVRWPIHLYCAHPPYEEQDPPYKCRGCNEELGEYDDCLY